MELEVLNDQSILAYVGITKSESPNDPKYICYFDYQKDSIKAQKWIEAVLKILVKFNKIFVEVFEGYRPFIIFFSNNNFKVRRIYTVSSAKEMIQGFRAHFSSNLKIPEKLQIRKLNSSDIPYALKILKEEFTKPTTRSK